MEDEDTWKAGGFDPLASLGASTDACGDEEDESEEEEDGEGYTQEQAEAELHDAVKDMPEAKRKAVLGLRARFAARMDKAHADACAKYLDRWADLSGHPGDYDAIDYDNPYIQLEYRMCDMKTLLRLSSKRKREETLASFPPEVAAAYWTAGPGCSRPYCDVVLTPAMVRKGVKTELKARRRAAERHAIIHRLTPEEKEGYRAMKAAQKEARMAAKAARKKGRRRRIDAPSRAH